MPRPALLFAAMLLAASARAQVPDAAPGEGPQLAFARGNAAKRLAEIDAKLAAAPAEAADELRKLLTEAGDELVPVGGKRYRPARQAAQRLLARLPAGELRAYRDRVDEPARKLLADGQARRDPRPLQALVDQYLLSRQAEEALWWLGELAFERGEFRAAEGHWRRLKPPREGDDEQGVTERTLDPAAVAARVALAVLFQGDDARAAAGLAAFRQEFPAAKGRLAGREGVYAETLQGLIDRPPLTPPEPSARGEWTTLGGSPTRAGRSTAALPKYWPSRPTWRVGFPGDAAPRPGFAPRPTSAKALGLHPVVMGGVGYVADAARVFAFDPQTGAAKGVYDSRTDPEAQGVRASAGVPGAVDADFALTAADGKLYARLGQVEVAPPPAGERGAGRGAASAIVCLEPTARGLAARFKLRPPVPEGVAAAWEAAPVWAEGRLYAAFLRESNSRLVQAVACYADTGGTPVWVADVTDAGVGRGEARTRAEPLTLAGANVVFCTQSGFVVALDRLSGKPAWAYAYPPRPPGAAAGGLRDVSPPVSDLGRVFVAPNDSDTLTALDALTGRVLWQAERVQVDQILGVAAGRLVVTVAGPVRGIRGYHVGTGSAREPEGWSAHDDPQLGSFGRGLVSEAAALWPTKSGVFFVRPSDGLPLGPRLRGPHGNLAFADGVLLVGTATEVWGYAFDRPADPPPPPQYGSLPAARQALILAGGGDYAGAEALLDRAEPALDAAATKSEWARDRAVTAQARRDPDAATRHWREGLTAGPPTHRAAAALGLALLAPEGGSDAALRAFLDAEKLPANLLAEPVAAEAGPPARLGVRLAKHFGAAVPAAELAAPTPAGPFAPRLAAVPTLAGVRKSVALATPGTVALLPFDAASTHLPGLEPGETPLLLAADAEHLFAYRPLASSPLWALKLPPGVGPLTHAARFGDTIVAAGPNGAARVGLDGTPRWHLPRPDADAPPERPRPAPAAPRALTPAAANFTGFALGRSHLLVRWGDAHLAAIALATGEFAWVRDAAGRAKFTPTPLETAPRVAGFAAVDGSAVAAFSDGTTRQFDLVTGTPGGIFTRAPAGAAQSAALPTPVPLGRGAVAVPDGPGGVRAVQLGPNSGPLWGWAAPAPAGWSGAPPQVKSLSDGLLVGVARNVGFDCDRLDPDTGAARWAAPATVLDPTVDLADAAADEKNLYLPAAGRLTAFRLADGRKLWAVPLDSRVAWRAHPTSGGVAVVPKCAIPVDDEPFDARLLAALLTRPPAAILARLDAWATRRVPVRLFARDSGQVEAEIELPAIGPAVAAGFAGENAVVVTGGVAHWLAGR